MENLSSADNTRTQHLLRRTTTAVASVLVVCVALVTGLSWLVFREIDDLSTANSDNIQWSLAQVDVEYLRFLLALKEAETAVPGDPALDAVRRRFDVFYSRMKTIENGEIFRSLQDDARLDTPRVSLDNFLDATTPLIDSSDAALVAALPELTQATYNERTTVRTFSLAGLSAFAGVSDVRREKLVRLLLYSALALIALFAVLSMLAYTLFRLARLTRASADEVYKASRRFRTVVETSRAAIVVTDMEGIIRDFNPAAEKIFGYTRAEALGREAPWLLLPIGKDGPMGTEHFVALREGRRPRPEERHFETNVRARDGRIFLAEFAVDRSESDKPLYVSFVRDISGRKEAEEELKKARDRALAGERSKSEFLAVMSHEMRTPLNGLMGAMQLLNDHRLNADQHQLLERMQTSGKQLLHLVNDVLDLAKFEAGKMTAEQQAFNLDEVVSGVITTADPLAQAAHNSLEWHWVGSARSVVMGDSQRLRQVLLNLVANATKFTKNGRIDVEVECLSAPDNLIEFRVIDSGIGIAEEDLDRVFGDFVTLDSSYTREVEGTGLGLGIAKRFVNLMRGEIGVESTLGVGSRFWVRLPLPAAEGLPASPPAPQQPAAESPALAPQDILVVEDTEMNRFIVGEFLTRAGHKVSFAENGQEGVDAANAQRFDAILMDISMPIMDGREATRLIRGGNGASRDVPVIALTAHVLPEEIELFKTIGITECLSKPIQRDVLLSCLARVVTEDNAPDRSEPAATPDTALIDETTALAFHRDLPEGAAEALIARFFAAIDSDIDLIAGCDPTSEDLQAIVHRCAGACGTFGALALHRALHDIEAGLKQGDLPSPGSLSTLPALWQQSRAALDAVLTRDQTSVDE
nr:ATP-binding protein [uncultured Celeribacter sp.]